MNKMREISRRGSALVTLMVVILLVSIAGAALVGFAKQQAFSITRVRDGLKAQAYAEAGANEAYSVLKAAFANAQDPSKFPVRTFGDGEYDATVTPVGADQASIVSVGKCGAATITVKCDVMDMGPSVPGGGGGAPGPEPPAYDYAILVGGYFKFRGCGDISGGGVGGALLHANGEFSIQGSCGANLDITSSTLISAKKVTIDGNTTAPAYSLHSKTKILGTKTTAAVPAVEIPDIDLTPYYNHALANGEVHNGFSTSASYTPNGGILWVNGDVQISSHAVINGSIIATGDIHVSGAVEVNAGAYAFAMASRDGEIQNTSSGKITGLIYCRTGDYKHTANGETEGQIIVAGDVEKGGNSDIMVFAKNVPTPPGGGGGGGSTPTDHVVITAWQQ